MLCPNRELNLEVEVLGSLLTGVTFVAGFFCFHIGL